MSVVEWGKLSAAKVQGYISNFAPKITEILTQGKTEYIGSWGGAFIATFDSATRAANCALDIKDLFTRTSISEGLPSGLSCCVALHQGETIRCADPINSERERASMGMQLISQPDSNHLFRRDTYFALRALLMPYTKLTGWGQGVLGCFQLDTELLSGTRSQKIFVIGGPNSSEEILKDSQLTSLMNSRRDTTTATDVEKIEELKSDYRKLKDENAKLKERIKEPTFNGLTYNELRKVLSGIEMTLPDEVLAENKKLSPKISLLNALYHSRDALSTGVADTWTSVDSKWICWTVVPRLITFGLVERDTRVPTKAIYRRYMLSKSGHMFLAKLTSQLVENKEAKSAKSGSLSQKPT